MFLKSETVGKSYLLGYGIQWNSNKKDGPWLWEIETKRERERESIVRQQWVQLKPRSYWLSVSAGKLLGDYSGDIKAPTLCLIQHCFLTRSSAEVKQLQELWLIYHNKNWKNQLSRQLPVQSQQ